MSAEEVNCVERVTNGDTGGFGEAEMQEAILPAWLDNEERKIEIPCFIEHTCRLYHAVK
jgi:hypothetical protein